MNTQQTEALRLATFLDGLDVRTPDRIQNCVSAAAELRRLDRVELAYQQWSDKTEWVQGTGDGSELGMHIADVLKQRIENLTAVNAELVDALKGMANLYPPNAKAIAAPVQCEWVGTIIDSGNGYKAIGFSVDKLTDIPVGTRCYTNQPAAPTVQEPQRYSPDGEGGMEVDSLGAYVKLQDVTTPPAAPVTRGWMLVPIDPIQEMLDAPPNAYPADALVTWNAMISKVPTPPAAPVPLTDEQIADIQTAANLNWVNLNCREHREAFVRAIEAAHGIAAAPQKGQ